MTEKQMHRLQLLKSYAHGKPISKSANLAEIMEIGMTTLMVHNVLHGRLPDNDGPDFDKSDMDGLFGAVLDKAVYGKNVSKDDTQVSIATSPPDCTAVAKSIDEDKGLVTAVILRPDIADLHGDIYDSAEVEKACFNFNTRCGKTNIQHEEMANFQMVESFIAKADAKLGEGEVKKGDWIGTMHIEPTDPAWAMVKSGDFTGFSVGCKANYEVLT